MRFSPASLLPLSSSRALPRRNGGRSVGGGLVLDAECGCPVVVFNVTLEFDAAVDTFPINNAWEVYEVVDGARRRIEGGLGRPTPLGTVRSSVRPPRGVVEPGHRDGGRVSPIDLVHDLAYEHRFDFSAPAVPFGIALPGWSPPSQPISADFR